MKEEFEFYGTYSIPIQDEENIMAWLATETFIRRKNGYLINGGTVTAHNPTAPWLWQTNLEKFAKDFSPLVPNAHSILLNHTAFRLATLLLSDEERAVHHERAMKPPNTSFQGAIFGHSKSYRAVCPTCVDSPSGKYSYATYDRLLNVPGVKVCPTHKQVLLRPCKTCSESLNFSRPSLTCCDNNREPVAELSSEMIEFHAAVGAALRRVLQGELDGIPAEKIMSAIVENVAERQPFSEAPNNVLRNCLVDKLGESGLLGTGLKGQMIQRISGHLNTGILPRNPVQIMIVILVLFEDFDSFVTSIRLTSSASPQPLTVSRPRHKSETELCLSKKKTEDEFSVEIDNLVSHIHVRYQTLISSIPGKRISRQSLLKGGPSRKQPLVRRSPAVERALEMYADCPQKQTFIKRVTGILCKKVLEISPDHPYGNEERYQNLTPAYLRLRLHILKKWLDQQ